MRPPTDLFLILTGLLLLTLSTATIASAQVCGSLNLTTQAEVDVVSCSSVSGDVYIEGADITNLDGLGDITSVSGYLQIYRNDALTNIDALGDITSVGGNLEISYNDALTNLGGLGGINGVDGYLYIVSNNSLTNLTGLSGITSVGGYLDIRSNSALTNLDALGGITSIPGYLFPVSARTRLNSSVWTRRYSGRYAETQLELPMRDDIPAES